MRDMERVLASHAFRGLPYTCKRGFHRMRLVTRAKVNGIYKTTTRCKRCGLVRQETGLT